MGCRKVFLSRCNYKEVWWIPVVMCWSWFFKRITWCHNWHWIIFEKGDNHFKGASHCRPHLLTIFCVFWELLGLSVRSFCSTHTKDRDHDDDDNSIREMSDVMSGKFAIFMVLNLVELKWEKGRIINLNLEMHLRECKGSTFFLLVSHHSFWILCSP